MVDLRVVVDERERLSGVPAVLKQLGVQVTYRMLDVGDYLVSNEVAVERKSVLDLVNSLYEGRLFEQTERLALTYKTPVLVVEGEPQLLLSIIPNQKVFWGALTRLSLISGIFIFQTSSREQTAMLLQNMAAREAFSGTRRPLVSFKKLCRKHSFQRIQLAIVSALPGMGPKLAHRLLTHYGTLKAIFYSSAAELATVKGIGKIRAEVIVSLLNRRYSMSAYEQIPRLWAQDS